MTLPSEVTAKLAEPCGSRAPFAKSSPPAQASGADRRTEWRPTGTSSKRAVQVFDPTGIRVTCANPQKLGWMRTCPAQARLLSVEEEINAYRNSTSAVTGEGPVGKPFPPLQAMAAISAANGQYLFTLPVYRIDPG